MTTMSKWTTSRQEFSFKKWQKKQKIWSKNIALRLRLTSQLVFSSKFVIAVEKKAAKILVGNRRLKTWRAWISTASRATPTTWVRSWWTRGPTWTPSSWLGTITHSLTMLTTALPITTATRQQLLCSTPITQAWTVSMLPIWQLPIEATRWGLIAAITSSAGCLPTRCRWQQLGTCQALPLSTVLQFLRPHTCSNLQCQQGQIS